MTLVRTLSAIAALIVATSTWAASDAQHDGHHPAPTTAVRVAQATTDTPAPTMGNMTPMGGMPGMEAQMKSMRDMHDKMLAAKTPEERKALMTEQMGIMQKGMNMMGGMSGMGAGAMMGKPGDMATRQSMMEQRMEMMQSMMQMMMDRTQSLPMTK